MASIEKSLPIRMPASKADCAFKFETKINENIIKNTGGNILHFIFMDFIVYVIIKI